MLEVKVKGDIHDVTVNFVDANGGSVGQIIVQDAFARVTIPSKATTVVFSKEAAVASS